MKLTAVMFAQMLGLIRCVFRLTQGAFWVVVVTLLIPPIYLMARKGETWRPGFPERCMHLVSRRFYSSFNVKVRYIGEVVEYGNMVMPNHISWLDIIVITGRYPFGFVAKSEVRNWPLFGAMGAAIGTLFINRESKFSVYRSLPEGQKMLRRGQTLAVFPEGTTTRGDDVLHYYPMTFEIAVREKALVQPIVLRYLNEDGQISKSAPFVDDDGFLQSLFRVARSKSTHVEVHFLEPLVGAKLNRKELAKAAQAAAKEIIQLEGHYPEFNPLPAALQ